MKKFLAISLAVLLLSACGNTSNKETTAAKPKEEPKQAEQKEVSNIQLYKFTLKHQFRLSHMNELLHQWKAAKKIQILDKTGQIVENAKGFGLIYKNFKSDNVSYIFKKR